MRALLMHRDRDFDLAAHLPSQEAALSADLALPTLLGAMAGDDEFMLDVARKALFSGLDTDVDTVLYRQGVLKDCVQRPEAARRLYQLAVQAITQKKKHYFSSTGNYPASTLHTSIDVLQMFIAILRELKEIAVQGERHAESEGLTNLFAMLRSEFSDEYVGRVQNHLSELKFSVGVLVSVRLGTGNEGTDYVLRRSIDDGPSWLDRLLGRGPPAHTFHIADRDDAGARALSELRDRGIHLAANALAQSMDHILGFFEMLRAELAFYVGCLNLHSRLVAMNATVCYPHPQPRGARRHHCSGLYDVSLTLAMKRGIVGNRLDADGKNLVIITGANQGGKSSFLRSVGLAQLMMQSGMFVAAESFASELCSDLFTHYKREEDATMKSGKLDEELARMSGIADAIGANAMLLFNESFASTNEREGSEIARQIVCALLERQIKVFFVTHQYQFAHGFFASARQDNLFLRAERRADGTRSFKLIEGEPLEASHGEDLYRQIFGVDTVAATP